MDYGKILAGFADMPGGLIESYHAIQKEMNYLPEEAIVEAAKAFNISTAEAYEAATFYSMFSLEKRGKNIIRICESAPCHIAGAAQVVEALENELGINMNESTDDGKFTLEYTECVGQCQSTPVITINGKPYFDVTPAEIPAIIAACK